MRLKRTGSRSRRVVGRRRMPRKFRRTGLRRHRSTGTAVRVYVSDYFSLSSTGGGLPVWGIANFQISSIMASLIANTPSVANYLATFEFVALKRATVTFHTTGVTPFSNSTNNALYPALHSAMYMDSYNAVTGLGTSPARALSRMPGSIQALGRARLTKTFYTGSICKKLDMPYWQSTSTIPSAYYVPPTGGLLPVLTLGVNCLDGVSGASTAVIGLTRISAVLVFKNTKIT